ncbi:polyamine oxidase [Nitzschia inconspicua]|uniref:Polyamine oxidase n=1 Tax=Nitzschia inconspicua TaxID=303405 RepID=A0A9K3LIN2_9STRA|nr:polyamine oxidase [Nitzschia inconspicua]
MTSSPLSVVLVGAGAAGLRLAQILLTEAPRPIQVTILEANDYCGGRVRNISFDGYTVEMGANWISGLETAFDNPIWRLAKNNGLRTNPSDRENPCRMHVVDCTKNTEEDGRGVNGGPVITDLYLKQAKMFDEVYAKSLEEVNSSVSSVSFDKDVDVRSLLQRNGWTPTCPMDYAIEHNLLEVWVAEDLSQLSAEHNMKVGANDMDLGQDEVFVEDPRGFRSIFEDVIHDLETSKTTTIQLGTEVQSIQYAPKDTKVLARDLKTGCVVEYSADIVVSTVSLGVLQNGSIRFNPPLPKWKVDALNEVGMFNFGKVFAKFRTRLWPEDKDYLLLVSKQPGYYPLWMRYQHCEDPILMCYLGGANARRVESLSEEEIQDEIEELFGKAFGHSNDCRPIKVTVTDWSKNPRFNGSYSYFPKGAFASVCKSDYTSALSGTVGEIARPVPSSPKTLYFAGEAFDDKYNGWVQGGYLSGERVGRTILQDHFKERF